MTTKVKGTEGIEFPDATVQATAAYKGPAFKATLSASQSISANAEATVLFNTEEFDTASCFNTSTGRFTPNVAGYYAISAMLDIRGTSLPWAIGTLQKNGVSNAVATVAAVTTNKVSASLSSLYYLNGTTDYVSCTVFVPTGVGTPSVSNSGSQFSGSFARAA